MTIIKLDKNLYSDNAIKRALINYDNYLFYKINQEDLFFVVELEPKSKEIDLTLVTKEIINKVIEEDIRINIENETKSIREAIYKKALSTENNNDEA